MNIEKRTHLRNAILIQLEAICPGTLPLDTLYEGIKTWGYTEVDRAQLQKELSYLKDTAFLEISSSHINQAHLRYRILAKGQDYLQAEGLI